DERDRELLRAVLEAGDERGEGLELAREREPDGDLVEGLDRLLLHHLCALHRDALLGRERVRPLLEGRCPERPARPGQQAVLRLPPPLAPIAALGAPRVAAR